MSNVVTVMMALTLLPSPALAAEGKVIEDGHRIHFDITLVLPENRSTETSEVTGEFRDKSMHRCFLTVNAPPFSRPEISEGTELQIKWVSKSMQLLEPGTENVRAKMYCYFDSANLGSMYMHPSAVLSEKLTESHLREVLSARIVGDVVKPFQVSPLPNEDAPTIDKTPTPSAP